MLTAITDSVFQVQRPMKTTSHNSSPPSMAQCNKSRAPEIYIINLKNKNVKKILIFNFFSYLGHYNPRNSSNSQREWNHYSLEALKGKKKVCSMTNKSLINKHYSQKNIVIICIQKISYHKTDKRQYPQYAIKARIFWHKTLVVVKKNNRKNRAWKSQSSINRGKLEKCIK